LAAITYKHECYIAYPGKNKSRNYQLMYLIPLACYRLHIKRYKHNHQQGFTEKTDSLITRSFRKNLDKAYGKIDIMKGREHAEDFWPKIKNSRRLNMNASYFPGAKSGQISSPASVSGQIVLSFLPS
jgi:hypothetical protein